MKRRPEFSAHPAASDFLRQINDVVALGEDNIDVKLEGQSPLVLVVGAPRSGTTVLMQWLARVGFAVPSNIAARFSRNPYFAGLLQRLLTDQELNFRDELTIAPPADGYHSDYGKTVGPLSPHEFSFYFRRFFPVSVGERLSAEALSRCDIAGFLEGMRRFGAGLGRPAALKALLIQYHLELFVDADNVIVLHVHRDEVDNTCSLLRHRETVAGDVNEWISVRPPQYEWLRHLSPTEQVAGQVHFTNVEIAKQLRAFSQKRVISLAHEDFCADPRALHTRLNACLAATSAEPLPAYSGPERFELRGYDQDPALRDVSQSALESVQAYSKSDVSSIDRK